ncbi:hypothetical protein DR950_18235 [Kitasatospora xanthocidica]|uniref:Uncharacterized protein n=1 Tax=Kitasatospora xanthocidica TaxID=83382 RepID=A0A372ZVF1_9ACTN|nr:hypothetical protein [Kitasatospora xanthocidica]RGD59474.1 hypothetical protein DR950_18235 [Kitasatospora xanthocidica]
MGQEHDELEAALAKFERADAVWQAVKAVLDSAASDRVDAMKDVVDLVGQTVAAPLLNLDQSTISRTLSRPREPRKIPLPPAMLDLFTHGSRFDQARDLVFGDLEPPGQELQDRWIQLTEANKGWDGVPKPKKAEKKKPKKTAKDGKGKTGK